MSGVGWTPCKHYPHNCIGWCPLCVREYPFPSTVVRGKVLHCVTYGSRYDTGTMLAIDLDVPVMIRQGDRVVVMVEKPDDV